jgi:hypothetical protein
LGVKQPNIRLHIEELVLHSFAPNDRYAIADAVERELSRLLAADLTTAEIPPSLADSSGRPRVDAGNFPVAPGAKAGSIGNQIAQAVHGGITK